MKSFAQKDSVEISIHILPELDIDFRNQKIAIIIDLDTSKRGFEIDTLIEYPFRIKLPFFNNLDSVSFWLRGSLEIGEHNLWKEFNAFYFLNISSKATKKIEISFPENCKSNINFRNKVCPTCLKSDQVIPVIYGLPVFDSNGRSPLDDFDYYPWGCDMPTCGYTWHCKRDNIEF